MSPGVSVNEAALRERNLLHLVTVLFLRIFSLGLGFHYVSATNLRENMLH